jgi:hypothetical protein
MERARLLAVKKKALTLLDEKEIEVYKEQLQPRIFRLFPNCPSFTTVTTVEEKQFYNVMITYGSFVDPHWFQSKSGSGFFINVDPDPGCQTM